jgi:diadenosine tetraphosphatase ApaH/serine/threonine PP2A family protein phosphatase
VRIGVLSDIHGNFTAMESVLKAMGPVDMVWCLGDLVGYGAQPNECVERIRQFTHRTLRGNHDLAALGLAPISLFNAEASAAAKWTAAQLTPENRAFLLSLPEQSKVDSKFTLCHGSPRDPVWEYLLDRDQALANFELFDTQVCLIGHTHIPLMFDERGEGGLIKEEFVLTRKTQPFQRLIINPGSVGQPRDRNPKAAYMILETFPLRFEWRRVAYDIDTAQRHIINAGLPKSLADRLFLGR